MVCSLTYSFVLSTVRTSVLFMCMQMPSAIYVAFFFFNVTATTEIYPYLHTLSLPDALPICAAQFARIKKAFNAIKKAERAGRDGVDEDLAFHTEISQACGNPLYTSLLSYLSLYLHTAIVVTRANEAQRDDFSRQVHEEHTAIMDAISRKDPGAARAAALHHMEGAASRLKAIDAASWTAPMDEAARRLNHMRE